MPIEKIVINASPLILLAKSGYFQLLPKLFTEIWIPESVSQEIISGNDQASDALSKCEESWLVRCLVNHVEEVKVWNLGDGETEVLSFALNKSDQFRTVL